MLTAQAIATVISGVRESPRPRITLPSTLYSTMARLPPPQMAIYCRVSRKASSGAFMSRASTADRSGSSRVSASPTRPKKAMLTPITLPQSFSARIPSFCPSRIVLPMARELMRPVTVIMICEPTATPETSAVAAYLPTTSRSTAP